MPELPEVQTVLDTLSLQIKDAKIKDIKILFEKIIEDDPDLFKQKLTGQHFRAFKRRGKYLLFEMDDLTLVCHLRMEGKFFIFDGEGITSKHDHVIFYLDDGRSLHYNDVRKFGRMYLTEKKQRYVKFRDLGPEPFWNSFNKQYCKNYLSRRQTPIKEVLLDQSFVAGIGNIYADEILFASRINPLEKACRLNDDQIAKIIRNTRTILNKAIAAGGTTIRSYTSSLGVTGLFQMSLQAHDQKKCPRCKKDIVKIRVGGRGTYYCPRCQKLKKKIAVSGSIGSGKSMVCAHLRERGFDVFDCDETNRRLLEPGEKGYLAIEKAFPMCFEDGKLDKKKLSSIVFENEEEKKKLEGIMHPLILEKMFERKDDPLFAEVPLLFEANWDIYFDETLLVVTDETLLLERLVLRGLSKEEAIARLKNQMSVAEKIKRADKIIYNNGSLEDLYKLVDDWLEDILCWEKTFTKLK